MSSRRDPKSYIYFRNHLFGNQIWLAVVIIVQIITCFSCSGTSALNQTNNQQPLTTTDVTNATNATTTTVRPKQLTDCAKFSTCDKCTGEWFACAWQLATQTCANYTADEKDNSTTTTTTPSPLSVYEATSCPVFTVNYTETSNPNGLHHLAVNVTSGCSDAFWTHVRHAPLTCRLNELEFTGFIMSRCVIVCKITGTPLNTTAAATASPFVYVTVNVGGVPLAFDNRTSHYLETENDGGCGGPRKPCVTCSWDDYENGDGLVRYYCRWCPERDDCMKRSRNCDVRVLSNATYPAHRADVMVRCSDAMVEWTQPPYAPVGGGTKLQIAVRNHVAVSPNRLIVVTVAGSKCLLPVMNWVNGTLECTISPWAGNASVGRPVEGPVLVSFVSKLGDRKDRFTLVSNHTFFFVEPDITGLRPTCGIINGGTRVKIIGNYLDAATALRVYMHENISCDVTYRSQNLIECVTSASDRPLVARVRLEFDGYLNRYSRQFNFRYTTTPSVHANQTFCGIAAGGTRVPVGGESLSCVENPMMYVMRNEIRHTAECRVIDDTHMECSAPRADRPLPHNVTELSCGFQATFDRISLLMTMPADPPPYRMYPDPVYTDFESDGGRTITINGLRLDRGYAVPEDLSVRLQHSKVPCNVTSVSARHIKCQIPAAAVGVHLVNGIVVTLGSNVVYQVKRKPVHRAESMHLGVFFSGMAIVLLVVAIVLAAVQCMRVAVHASNRQTELEVACEYSARHQHTAMKKTTDSLAAAATEDGDDKKDETTPDCDRNGTNKEIQK